MCCVRTHISVDTSRFVVCMDSCNVYDVNEHMYFMMHRMGGHHIRYVANTTPDAVHFTSPIGGG